WSSLKQALPEGEIGISTISDDMTKVLCSVSSDVDPGSVYLFDAATGKATLQYRSRPELPSEHLAPMKPVSFTARDGMTIHGYLTLPRGLEAKNLPVVMYIHGGPWARDYWGYEPYCQFLANRGYAVMQVNYRSSSGYGKAYSNAGNREWGIGAMQHDVTDAVQYLIAEGIADPAKVAIFGGSYGGYATLAGVTFTPDLYACGIPYVGPSNLITLIESFPEYWKPFLEGSWYKKVGNPDVESDRQDLIARSPLFHCDQIKVPLLVVHGANDPRVKQHESDQIVVALRQKGKAVEYIVAPDEGHGFRAPGNRKALAVAMEKFLARQLGGRFQEDVRPDTQKRLDEITVDVGTVVVSEPGEG
ncbi:S9 family peptidase, partial [bacterium]|nr:S9 family peptidase [bacterium]